MEPVQSVRRRDKFGPSLRRGARGISCQDLVKKKDLSPSSVKNVNLRPQANPGHRRAWLRPQETGANQVELRKCGVFGLDLKRFEPIK